MLSPDAPSAASVPLVRCLIVDDEPLGRRAIRSHIEAHPLLDAVAEARDGMEAMAALRGGGIDAVFLDLEMPKLTGFEMLRALPTPPLVVVVTAYSDRAVEGFDVGVVDYLVKPVARARFAKAAARLLSAADERTRSDASPSAPSAPSAEAGQSGASAPGASTPGASFFVPTDQGAERIDLDDLRYAEAWGNYVRLHLPDRVVLTKGPLYDVARTLPDAAFVRVHRSYVVAVRHIQRVTSSAVVVDGQEIPVSERHRQTVTARLGLV
ncbi:MAG: LytTR family DNA-binding domain-containing protein [Bacteroidota bacterium]